MYPKHHEEVALIDAPREEVFAFVDDQSKLSSHMSKRSWMMGGGVMTIETDAMQGKAVGSHLQLAGSIWGLQLQVKEIVTERIPPQRKVWETIGVPRLLVIGPYQMGVDIEPQGLSSQLRVFINYALPTTGVGHWLGLALGRSYAKWCTSRMARDAAQHFRQRKNGPDH